MTTACHVDSGGDVPLPVKIQDIVDGMEFQSDTRTSYLHRVSGVVYPIGDEHGGFDDFEADEEGVDAIAQAIENDPDSYIALPDRFEIDEYRMMERFALASSDSCIQKQLQMALRGSGVFRRFKDAVHRLGIAPAWYQVRGDAVRADRKGVVQAARHSRRESGG